MNNPRGLAPAGWHVPTDAEFTTLISALGGESVAGGKMKVAGTSLWLTLNTGGTNSSVWAGLPGDFRFNNGTFCDVGYYGSWWSASAFIASLARYSKLDYGSAIAIRNSTNKRTGFYVRCVRD